MSFKSEYLKYCKAMKKSEEAQTALNNFFSQYDLDYAVTYCAGDGVMILCEDGSLCATPTEADIDDLSKAKTKDDVLKVVSRLNFDK